MGLDNSCISSWVFFEEFTPCLLNQVNWRKGRVCVCVCVCSSWGTVHSGYFIDFLSSYSRIHHTIIPLYVSLLLKRKGFSVVTVFCFTVLYPTSVNSWETSQLSNCERQLMGEQLLGKASITVEWICFGIETWKAGLRGPKVGLWDWSKSWGYTKVYKWWLIGHRITRWKYWC